MMKKLAVMSCGFFSKLSKLNLDGKMCVGELHEPKPPHLRGK